MLSPRPGDVFPVILPRLRLSCTAGVFARPVVIRFPGRLAPDRLQVYPVKILIKKPGLYVPRFYSIGFPSLSVQVIDTHPPKAAAMACNSCTVNLSLFNLLFKFCGVCPVARARSESDSPARLHNSRICSLVFNSITVCPLAVEYTPAFYLLSIYFIKSLKSIK